MTYERSPSTLGQATSLDALRRPWSRCRLVDRAGLVQVSQCLICTSQALDEGLCSLALTVHDVRADRGGDYEVAGALALENSTACAGAVDYSVD